MSNGAQRCCILGICCPPPGGRAQQEDLLAHHLAEADNGECSYEEMAKFLLDNFDLVPKGVGAAIVEAYRPEFAKLHGHHADPPA